MTAPRLTYRMNEVADQLGVAPSTVQRWVAAGDLVAIRPSRGVVLIDPDDLTAFLASHREGRGVTPLRRQRSA